MEEKEQGRYAQLKEGCSNPVCIGKQHPCMKGKYVRILRIERAAQSEHQSSNVGTSVSFGRSGPGVEGGDLAGCRGWFRVRVVRT